MTTEKMTTENLLNYVVPLCWELHSGDNTNVLNIQFNKDSSIWISVETHNPLVQSLHAISRIFKLNHRTEYCTNKVIFKYRSDDAI